MKRGHGRRWAYWSAAILGVVGVLIGIVGNLFVTPPLPPWLEWVKDHSGWALIALVATAIVLTIVGARAQESEPTTSSQAKSSTLQPRYDDESSKYRHRKGDAPWILEHRLGIFNDGDAEAENVRLIVRSFEPKPRNVLLHMDPVIPSILPRLSGGDPSVGIALPSKREEFWIVGYTASGSDGSLSAAEFAPLDGRWRGMYWQLDPDERWRLSYEIVAEGLPTSRFSLVVSAAGDQVRVDLEG